jgi:hypothetical protein
MNFPELQLGRKAQEKKRKEALEDEVIVNQYDVSEKKINDDWRANKVYPGKRVKQRSYTVNDYVIIEHNGKFYPVIRILSKKKWLPLVVDLEHLNTVVNFEAEGVSGNWNLANRYVSFSKKKGKTMYYLHNILMNYEPDGAGKDSVDHLNRIHLDNRLVNLQMKSQSDQNVNQKVRKCASTQINKMPEPYRTYYLQNRPRYIYWLPSRTHGHRMFVGPCGPIKEKKFSSKDPKQIPKLMEKAEKYLMTEARKFGMTDDQITSELDTITHQLKREYTQIILKASKFFQLDL